MNYTYKLYGYEDAKTMHIGDMELPGYLYYLNNQRHFNEELAISHTLRHHNMDLTEIFKNQKYIWNKKANIYEPFPNNEEDDGSRTFFNNRGRNKYMKFMNYAGFRLTDCLTEFKKYNDIHHIYPLVYGGKSNLENLIHISHFNHDLLHLNPLENVEIECHKAVDYLGYLNTPQMMRKLIEKYELTKYNQSMFFGMWDACVKEEMKKYYSKLI